MSLKLSLDKIWYLVKSDIQHPRPKELYTMEQLDSAMRAAYEAGYEAGLKREWEDS